MACERGQSERIATAWSHKRQQGDEKRAASSPCKRECDVIAAAEQPGIVTTPAAVPPHWGICVATRQRRVAASWSGAVRSMATGMAGMGIGGCRRAAAGATRALATSPLATAILALPVATLAALLVPAPSIAGEPDCRLDTIGTGAVSAVIDGTSFRLADGREVRLAALEGPLVRPKNATEATAGAVSAAAHAATAALGRMLSGGSVTLQRPAGGSEETDRYGRLVAYAVVNRDGIDIPVQAAMLAGGHARVAARVGAKDCAAALLAAEAQARKAKIGLWADPDYQVRRAEHPATILADAGRFAVVEGKVLSVRASGATIYVNFGRVWSRDFSVTIARRDERLFAAAGLAPATLAGRRLRVRGWVEARGGPQIAASRPEQIEIAEAQ